MSELTVTTPTAGVRRTDRESSAGGFDEATDQSAQDEALQSRFDAFIRQPRAGIRNSGPPVNAARQDRGGEYAVDQQAVSRQLVDDCVAAMQQISEQVRHHQDVNVDLLLAITERGIDQFVGDADCTLAALLARPGDSSLPEHASKMSLLGMAMAIEMGFDRENVRTIGIAGLISDLGMLDVDPEILSAQRRLTSSERLDVQKHCVRSANLAERMNRLPPVVAMTVYQVHERPDGSGYPRGKALTFIHPFARILHVADAYAAMTSARPDRPRMMAYEVAKNLLQQAHQRRVDADVVRALLACLSLFPIGSYVALDDGSVCRVLRASGAEFTKPVVRRLTLASGELLAAGDDRAVVDLRGSDLRVVKALPDPTRPELAVDVRDQPSLFHA
jgi:HD-GYP domain-containing protein (c-di-GMP phosphodiesterase class II)